MDGYSQRTNPYISATQGFVDAYMRGMQLVLQERRYGLAEKREARYEKYFQSQMDLRSRKAAEYPWKRFTADIPEGEKQLFEQHETTGETRPVKGFLPTKRHKETRAFTESYNLKGLGELETGSPSSMLGIPMEMLRTEDQHITYATKRWGPDWQTVMPEAVEIIVRKKPEGKLAKKKILFGKSGREPTTDTEERKMLFPKAVSYDRLTGKPRLQMAKQGPPILGRESAEGGLFIPESLGDLWNTMTEEERKTARRHLKKGGSIEAIRKLLGD